MQLKESIKSTAIAVAISVCMCSSLCAQGTAGRLQPVKSLRASAQSLSAGRQGPLTRAAASRLVVMASLPEGMEFAGVDENEQSLGDYAFAPANRYLSTKAKSTSRTASYTWTFHTLALGGKDTLQTSSGAGLNFRMSEGLHPAPYVTATDSGRTATYSLASDGIYFGYGRQGNHDCVNYQPSQCDGYYTDTSALTLNSDEANSMMDYLWAGVGVSGFKLRGFAETFLYSSPYYLEAVTAEVYSPTAITKDDIEAHVVARKRSSSGYSVDTVDIAEMRVSSIIPSQTEGRYRVVFEPAEAPRITSSIVVRIQTAEDSNCKLSIVFPQTKVYNSDNTATSSLYTDFKIGSSQVRKQILDFSGIEMADDDGNTVGYLNNFMIGLRKSYDKPQPSGITSVGVQKAADDRVFDISGKYVGRSSALQSLPRGIYIIGGKKIIK